MKYSKSLGLKIFAYPCKYFNFTCIIKHITGDEFDARRDGSACVCLRRVYSRFRPAKHHACYSHYLFHIRFIIWLYSYAIFDSCTVTNKQSSCLNFFGIWNNICTYLNNIFFLFARLYP